MTTTAPAPRPASQAATEIAYLDRAIAQIGEPRTEEEVYTLRALLRVKARKLRARTWQPLAHQVPPDRLSQKWRIWLLQGGRGSGKTRAGTEYVMEHLRTFGALANVGIGGPTFNDAKLVCMEGPSGIMTLYGNEFTSYNRTDGIAVHVGGGKVRFLGSEKPGRWNGPQWTLLWADELALWNEESWKQARFGVRLNPDPHIIATTTPKSRKFVKDLHTDTRVVVTKATINDNPHINEGAKLDLIEEFGGTRLGIQELDGEFLPDVEGASWKFEWIDEARVFTLPRSFDRIVVSVDPAGTASDSSDETAIAVVGREGREYYVLQVVGLRESPAKWAGVVLDLHDEWDADEIVAERNMGHELVEHTLKSVVPRGRIMPKIKTVHTKRGKILKADPIAALYERFQVHHYGAIGWMETEAQMCEFPIENEHDDRVDAIVQGLTALGGGRRRFRTR